MRRSLRLVEDASNKRAKVSLSNSANNSLDDSEIVNTVPAMLNSPPFQIDFSGQIRMQSIEPLGIHRFIGMKVVPMKGDGQMKAATIRFLLASKNNQELNSYMTNNSCPSLTNQRLFSCFAQDIDEEAKHFLSVDAASGNSVDDQQSSEVSFTYASPPINRSIWPSFNKLSGVQEFQNSIALYINIDTDNYINDFSKLQYKTAKNLKQTSYYVSFFAQARQTVSSPTIQRMMISGLFDSSRQLRTLDEKQRKYWEDLKQRDPSVVESIEAGLQEGIVQPLEYTVLFVRGSGDSFFYCGDILLHHVDTKSRPIKFVYEIVHSSTLIHSPSVQHVLQNLEN